MRYANPSSVVALLAAAVLVGGHAVCAAVIQTSDGLCLALDAQGQVAGLAAGERKLALTPGGGFYAIDAAVAEPENLLPNGSFEEAGAKGEFVRGWQTDFSGNLPDFRWLLDKQCAHSGRAARLEMPSKPPQARPAVNLSLAQPVAVKPGSQYRLTAWLRWEGCVPARGPGLYLVFRTAEGKTRQTGLYLGPEVAASEWQRFSQVFTPEPGETQAVVYANLYGAKGTAWLDDVSLVEVGKGPAGRFRHYLRAPLQRKGGALTQGERLKGCGLVLETSCATSGAYLSFSGKVTDLTGKDRAVEVGWELPLHAEGWVFGDDLNHSRQVSGDGCYRSTWECAAGPGYNATYPFSSLADGATGLSLGVPLAQGPRVYSLEYDAARRCLLVRFHFGLSRQARKLPGRAWFSFLLYRHDGRFGLRAAADRYYHLFPGDFAKRVPYEGYLGYAHLETSDGRSGPPALYGLPARGDFGRGFNWLWHQHNAYAAISYETDEAAHPDDATVYRLLEDAAAAQGAARPYGYSQAALNLLGKPRLMQWEEPAWSLSRKLYQDAAGKIAWVGDSRYTPGREGKAGQWLLNFQVNEDPELSPTLQDSLGAALAAWEADTPHREPYTWCLSNDGTGYCGRQLDLRPEHLAVSDVPLTYDRVTCRPAIADVSWEFNSQVLGPLSRQHQFLLHRNLICDTPFVGANLPFFDIGLIECQYGAYGMGEGSDLYARTAAYRRIVRYWFYPPAGEKHDAAVAEMFQRGLLYAIYPHLVPDAARLRDLYVRYLPAIERLSAAGWEPLTLATASQPGVRVERYGRLADANLSFAVRRPPGETAPADALHLRLSPALGLPPVAGKLEVRDLLSGDALEAVIEKGQVVIALSLEPGESTALTVLTREKQLRADLQEAARCLREAAALDPTAEVTYQPSRPGKLLQGDTPAAVRADSVLCDGWANYQGLIWPAGEALSLRVDLNSPHQLTWLRLHYGSGEAYELPEATLEGGDRDGNWTVLGKVPAGTASSPAPLLELPAPAEYQLLRLTCQPLQKMLWLKELQFGARDAALERASDRFVALSQQAEREGLGLASQLTIALRVRRMLGHDKTLQERALSSLADFTGTVTGLFVSVQYPAGAPAAGPVKAQVVVANRGTAPLREGSVKLKLPPGWSAAPAKFDLDLPPGQTVRLPVELQRAAEGGHLTLLVTGSMGSDAIFMNRWLP